MFECCTWIGYGTCVIFCGGMCDFIGGIAQGNVFLGEVFRDMCCYVFSVLQ